MWPVRTREFHVHNHIRLIATLQGDGFVVFQFLRLLSQNYQGLPPLDGPPAFDYPRVRLENIDVSRFPNVSMPDIAHVYPLRETAPYLRSNRVKPARVDIRLTSSQCKQLHAAVQTELRKLDQAVHLSRQDVLAGLLIYCISYAEPDLPPIQYMSNIVMVCSELAIDTPGLRCVLVHRVEVSPLDQPAQSGTALYGL